MAPYSIAGLKSWWRAFHIPSYVKLGAVTLYFKGTTRRAIVVTHALLVVFYPLLYTLSSNLICGGITLSFVALLVRLVSFKQLSEWLKRRKMEQRGRAYVRRSPCCADRIHSSLRIICVGQALRVYPALQPMRDSALGFSY